MRGCGRASSLFSAGEFRSEGPRAVGVRPERTPGEVRLSSAKLHSWSLHRAFVWQQCHDCQVPHDYGPCQHSVHVSIDVDGFPYILTTPVLLLFLLR